MKIDEKSYIMIKLNESIFQLTNVFNYINNKILDDEKYLEIKRQ